MPAAAVRGALVGVARPLRSPVRTPSRASATTWFPVPSARTAGYPGAVQITEGNERARRSDAAQAARRWVRCYTRDPGGPSDRGGSDHGPKWGVAARSL